MRPIGLKILVNFAIVRPCFDQISRINHKMARNSDRETTFHFKRFSIINNQGAMKVGTDGVILGGWVDVGGCRRIADVGAGTGLIALMIAQRQPDAKIAAIEIDPVACQEAEANVSASPFDGRIEIVNADFACFVSETPFDLIVSNPPFFAESLKSPDAKRAMARHESSLPLSTIFSVSTKLLTKEGRVALVLPVDRESDLVFQAALSGFSPIRKTLVMTVDSKPPRRCLWEFSRVGHPVEESTLTIKNAAGDYSDKYKLMLKYFYLNF